MYKSCVFWHFAPATFIVCSRLGKLERVTSPRFFHALGYSPFQNMDHGRDGYVTFEEFNQYFCRVATLEESKPEPWVCTPCASSPNNLTIRMWDIGCCKNPWTLTRILLKTVLKTRFHYALLFYCNQCRQPTQVTCGPLVPKFSLIQQRHYYFFPKQYLMC